MKHNLSKSLMTSHLSRFQRIATAILLTSSFNMIQPASADTATDIRDHNNRGNMLLARRLFQDAITEYETVLQIDPSHAIAKGNLALAHNEWGIWFYRARKYKEAKDQWDIAAKLNPNDQNVKRNLRLLDNVRIASPAAAAADAPPKPTGPQDWNPFDESLEKIPVKKPLSNAATTPPSNALVSGSTSAAATPGTGSNTPGGATSASTSTTQKGGVSSGATIISGGNTGESPFGTVDEASITGSAKSTSSGNAGGAVILSNTGSTSSGNSGTSASPPKGDTGLTSDVAVADAPANSVRIIGGSSGAASIIIGGSSPASSSGISPYGSTVSGGGGTANVFQTAGTPKPPVATTTSGNAPIRFTPRSTGGSVPMSWPGGVDSPAGADSGNKKSPNFLSKSDGDESDSKQKDDDTKGEDTASTVDDVLAKIENKVYGKVSKNMPILKRIERLEVETMGKKKSGSISDRLKELKETYGF